MLDVFALKDTQRLYGFVLPSSNLIGEFATQYGEFGRGFDTKSDATTGELDDGNGDIGAYLNAFPGFT